MNPVLAGPLSPELLQRMDAYWRAANYLSVGQIYLYDDPLLKKPLELSHVKPLVGGTGVRHRVRISSTCT
jgi:xylulose-5-phosphate/fructose-6-phosphate phosphoketolase